MGKHLQGNKTNSNAYKNKTHHNHHGRKKHTAVVFNEEERSAYLKGIFGAKKRRK